jgi:uncharacterized protein
MNSLPTDVLGTIASLLSTPQDFSSFSQVNKKTHTATQRDYILQRAKERFAKRVFLEDGKSFATYLPNGTKHGEEKKYNDDCQLKSKSFWKNGKKEGEELGWYENGQKRYECFWKNGKENGGELWWYRNGQLMRKCFWKDGKEEGEELGWQGNGQLERKRFWKDGKKIDERMWREHEVKQKELDLEKNITTSDHAHTTKTNFVAIEFI